MAKREEKLTILQNKNLGNDYFVMEFEIDGEMPRMAPGQFVQVLPDPSSGVMLRRPLSISDINIDKNSFSILVKVVGAGTRSMQNMKEGSKADIIYPLGNFFAYKSNKAPLLVGGGTGTAPMLFLSREMKVAGIEPSVILGGRKAHDIAQIEEFQKYTSKLFFTTEDGSLGEKGRVTDHSILNETFDKVFACGPRAMMHAMIKYADIKEIACEVSLENMMGCGFGVCLGCVEKTSKFVNRTVCMSGPVFNSKDLNW